MAFSPAVVICFLLLLPTSTSHSCLDGACFIDDETSLIQLTQDRKMTLSRSQPGTLVGAPAAVGENKTAESGIEAAPIVVFYPAIPPEKFNKMRKRFAQVEQGAGFEKVMSPGSQPLATLDLQSCIAMVVAVETGKGWHAGMHHLDGGNSTKGDLENAANSLLAKIPAPHLHVYRYLIPGNHYIPVEGNKTEVAEEKNEALMTAYDDARIGLLQLGPMTASEKEEEHIQELEKGFVQPESFTQEWRSQYKKLKRGGSLHVTIEIDKPSGCLFCSNKEYLKIKVWQLL